MCRLANKSKEAQDQTWDKPKLEAFGFVFPFKDVKHQPGHHPYKLGGQHNCISH